MSTQEERCAIALAESICGDRAKAVDWLNQPLASFDHKTPQQLIAEGRADSVIGYLHSIESGFVG
jgi:uncharacterized protein (DUF2384 family)